MESNAEPLFHDRTWVEYFGNMGPSAPVILLVSISLFLYLCSLVKHKPSTQDLIVYYFSALLPILIGIIGTTQGIIKALDVFSRPGIANPCGMQMALAEILPCLTFGTTTTAVFLALGAFLFIRRKTELN